MNQPLIAYSEGNLTLSSPTVLVVGYSLTPLSTDLPKIFVVKSSTSEAGNSFVLKLNLSRESMNVSKSEPYAICVKIPLNAGYLLLSIPPKINLNYLAIGWWISEWVIYLGSSFPYLMKATAFFTVKMYE